MIRVVVIAARPTVRAGLASLIDEADIIVVGRYGSLIGDDFDDSFVAQHAPGGFPGRPATSVEADVILIDPEGGSGEIDEAAQFLSGQRAVILGPVAGEQRLVTSLAGRAWAYLPRDAEPDMISGAIRAVANGLVALHPALASRFLGRSAEGEVDAAGDGLTPRELEVLQAIALGLPNKTIASKLGISEHTVKFHVASILGRLGASSRTEAVRIGARRGLLVL